MDINNEFVFVTKTFSADPETLRHAEVLAKEDGRHFSNLMRYLINAEWDRKHPQAVEEILSGGPTPNPFLNPLQGPSAEGEEKGKEGE